MRTRHVSAFAILMISFTPLFAQKKHNNKFDTTFARPHELSIAIGTSSSNRFPMGDYDDGAGPSFSIQYARVYKFNHFLRTGLYVASRSADRNPHYFFPAQPSQNNNGMPDNYTIQDINTRSHVTNTFANVFVGYEYGVGVRRFRFTFGADVLLGFHRRKINVEEDSYLVSRLLDPVSGLYQYNLSYLSSGEITGRSGNIFMAISPRIGIRRELGRRIALALTFTPQVGFTQRLRYTEKITDTKPTQYYNPKSTWFMSQNAELRLIIKLGKY